MSLRPAFLSFCVLALAGVAIHSSAAPPAAKAVDEAPFLRANNVAMRRMMMDMEVAPTGDIDRDFARMMIPHHQGGIDMARAVLRHGSTPAMKTLASAIIVKQQQEIELMRRFLRERK